MNLINNETVATFRDLLEPDEFKDFFLRAQQELERSHQQMQVHFAAQEWQRLKTVAHRLKGSLGSVGCDALFLKLDEIEEQLRQEPVQSPGLTQMQAMSEIAQETQRLLGLLAA